MQPDGAVCLFSCKKEEETGKLKVVATIFPLYDFAREIGGDFVSIKLLAADHSYEPSPQDMIAIKNADVFLFIGGESDNWAKKLSGKNVVNFIDKNEHDEHIWTNPKIAIEMVKKIAEVFSEKDTLNRDFYMKRNAELAANLTVLDSVFTDVVQNAIRKTIVFGDRFPFERFAKEYGLKHHAAFPGCSHSTEPSAAKVAFLIDKVKKEKIPVVFHIEFSNEKIANTIVEATGAKKMLMHSVHNVNDTSESYLKLMRQNAEALREALLNAEIHRDYNFTGAILFNVFDDRLEIMSLGGLVRGLNKETILRGVSESRNDKLAKVFFRLGYVEAYGTGIPRMFIAYKETKLQPTIEIFDQAFNIVLPNMNYAKQRPNIAESSNNTYNIVLSEVSYAKAEQEDEMYMLSDNEKAILSYLKKNKPITKEQAADIIKKKPDTAYRLLEKLVVSKYLKAKRNGRKMEYRLSGK